MGKLILLVGASGSGKTTIAKELEKKGYNIIHSYTTREPREENEWGHTFIPQLNGLKVTHITHSGLNILNVEGRVLSDNSPYIYYSSNGVIAFKDVYEGLYYWATKEQYQGKGTSIYVVDPDGAEQVQENVKDAEVITIFLMADGNTRRDRLLKRYDPEAYYQGTTWLPNEVSGRLEKDKEVFKTCKCDYVVDANRELDGVVETILEII